MNRCKHLILLLFSCSLLQGCGVYSFTGANVGNASTFQVNNFLNNAPIVEPGIARDFTILLQDLILTQTSLDLVNNGGDLIYEGEITEYYVAPITATAQSTAAQNRLTISVNVRFFNTLEPEKDFEQRFSFYFDYGGSAQLTGAQLENALAEIFERITQDIFNASLANW
ncbi:LptE family protein [Altibacter sp. HG106]|uniref:LptE family protein n=1 Tax=Altibacter sp. HG106 TaxID=3023937 RepID=UPI002350199B|nr:LptE family protein [Altibacter sp. HG106]MDC7994304.1 LptE family protein [Altibacter sp. HG106]